jgi:hypothetical protein
VTDERDGLLAYLAQQRACLRSAAFGLTDEQARLTPTVSALSIGGLIKHAAWCERGWIVGTTMQQEVPGRPAWDQEHVLGEDETLADALAFFDEVAAETDAIVADLPLDHPVPVPEAPWFPKDVEAWSLRWVLLHLIEELARHGGHADIIREAIDGRTFYELLYAADGETLPTG